MAGVQEAFGLLCGCAVIKGAVTAALWESYRLSLRRPDPVNSVSSEVAPKDIGNTIEQFYRESLSEFKPCQM